MPSASHRRQEHDGGAECLLGSECSICTYTQRQGLALVTNRFAFLPYCCCRSLQRFWTYTPIPEKTYFVHTMEGSDIITHGNSTLWEMGNK